MVPENPSIGLKKKHAPILAIAFCMLLPALTGSSVLNARHTAFDIQPARSFALISDLWRADGVNFPVYERGPEKPSDKAVVLASDGASRQAFHFSSHGATGYFDENGRNLQKAFLESPLMNARISSGFQDKRLHPVKKAYRRHPAIDYAAPAGSPVMSVGGGVVTHKGYSRSSGNYIKIRHPDSYASFYLHLSAVAKNIKKNTQVRKGEIIGFVGSTGWATGPHLDFRFMKNGRYVDYTGADLPAGKPVDADCLPQFRQNVARYYKQLASVS